MYSVYRHTAPCGKVYIGITKQKPKDRWQNGLGYKTQDRFYRAILKYGWDAFTHEILFEGLTLEEAEQKERELISLHRANDKMFGYNIEVGGNCNKGMSEETRAKLIVSHNRSEYIEFVRRNNRERWSNQEAHKKMSERFSGKNNPMYGKKLSEEHKKKLRESCVPPPILYGENNPWYGKHHSEETKEKISRANFGKKNGRAKIVQCVETGCVYDTVRDAFRSTGIHFSSISKCCTGVVPQAGGYHWRYVTETEVKL